MINVTKVYLPNKDKYKRYVDEIYKNGWITNNGPLVQKLEKRLEEYLGVRNLILTSNGTQALQIAYLSLDLKNEVITTPFSFVATTSSLVVSGLKPIYCDIKEEELTIDSLKIESLINKNTSAIVATHVFGNACEIDEIEKIANKNGLKVIYDAAHAFNVKYKNKSILSRGDISILSFHATKLFHTIEGGAIITNDDVLAKKIRSMINFGIQSETKIEHLGINAKMNEFEAAMGLCVLDDIDLIAEKRRKLYEVYENELFEYVKVVKKNKNSTENYSYFPILFKNEEKLVEIQKILNKENIYPRRYFYTSLDTLDYVNAQKQKISRDISKRILCLPLYSELLLEKQIKIIKIIKENL